jgi:hypothetical protein
VRALPWALLADVFGDELVERTVAAEHEDVVVGDGAEGSVLHGTSCDCFVLIRDNTRQRRKFVDRALDGENVSTM